MAGIVLDYSINCKRRQMLIVRVQASFDSETLELVWTPGLYR